MLCGLPSLGFLSLPHFIGPVATVSSFCFPLLFLLDASSVSLFLLCSSLQLWVVLRSLCGLQCSLWTYSLVGSDTGDPFLMSRVSAPRVSEFPVVSLMFSFRVPLLSFLSLGSSCDVGVPCVPSASLLSGAFGGFVCLLSVVLFLLSRFSSCLARPAFVSPCFRSLSSTAWSTSSALSSSSVPWRRGLLVCLQLRLCRRLGVPLPCPLLWLLPLRLPLGFHLLLSFYGVVLLFAWFCWGPVVPVRLVI